MTWRSSLGGLAALASLQPWSAVAQQRPPLEATSVADGFTFAAGGDILVGHPSPLTDRSTPVVDALRNADVSIANMEVSLLDLQADGAVPSSSGMFLTNGDPRAPQYLKTLGFDMFGFANNHTMNFGVEGARLTVRRLAEAGIVTAGYGETRSAARAPAFFDTPKGRVALVAFTSSYFPGTVAADPLGIVPGVPGVSALRNTRFNVVPRDQFAVLRSIDEELNPGAVFQKPPSGDTLAFRGVMFRAGDKPDLDYVVDASDRAELLRSIRSAKQQANFLVATMHSHEEPNCADQVRSGEGTAWRCGRPAAFVVDIAHAAIDNGADAFVGHGPHVLLGIEIYKGRPIFYSLGNIINEVGSVSLMRDQYPVGMDPAKQTDPEFFEKMWSYYEQDPTMYESVIATSRYEHDRLVEIRLLPVDLGLNRRQADRGAPVAAPPEMATKILKRLQILSAPFGTKIAIERNIGVIRLSAADGGGAGK